MSKREFDPCAWPGNGGSKQRKKKSRWSANDAEKTFIPGMPTVIPADLTKDKEQQYLVHLQIEEISRRLRSGDLGIPSNPEDRSPSPEPIYNNEGKRLNTREYRTRKKLEEERHLLVQRALENNTDYKPPSDYKPPVVRVNDKVMIPQDEHPDINFVGLLIGPRGNTLKNLEKETGAKIIIRGKGSVKEGKVGRKDGQPLPGEDEPLHAYVTANNPEHVVKAVAKIKEIIKQGIEVPEGQNDLRRQQLRELALLNGTLRENDGLNKLRQLQQAQTIVTNTIVCTKCGGTGHIAQDCKMQKPGDTFRNIQPENPADKAKMDSEYMSLMAELGEGPPPPKQNEPHQHNPAASMAPAGPRPFTSPPPPMGQWRPQPPPMGATPPGIININTHQPPPPIGAQQPPPGIPSQPPMNLAPQMPPGLSSQPPVGLGPQPPPGMGMQPPPVMTSQPQLGVGAPPPPMGSQPPPTLATQLPPGIMSQTSQAVSQPLSVSAPGILAPPTISTVAGVAPPWQPAASAAPVPPPGSSPAGVGVPPPSVLAAPPPPPPSSQPPTSLPWQPSHQPVQQHNAVGVPPPPAPWQQPSNMGGAAPMMPPPPPSGMAPWQPQAHPPPPPAPVHTVASAMAPPPPPPSQPGFNAVAPPPPPPASAGLQGLGVQGGLPLGVPPPPPPN